MRFVRATHKASHLRTCYPVWFGEESLLLPEGRLRASTKEDRRGGVAIATSVVPGKPTFPVGFSVVATCYIGRLEQVSLGGLEASWSANYTGRVWHSSLSPSVPSILTEIQLLVFQILLQSWAIDTQSCSFCLCHNDGIIQCLHLLFKVKATRHGTRTHLCFATWPRQSGIDSDFILFLTAAWIRARDWDLKPHTYLMHWNTGTLLSLSNESIGIWLYIQNAKGLFPILICWNGRIPLSSTGNTNQHFIQNWLSYGIAPSLKICWLKTNVLPWCGH